MVTDELGPGCVRDGARPTYSVRGEEVSVEPPPSSLDLALRLARPRLALDVDLEGRWLAGGRIQVGRRIGAGAMGCVYEALEARQPIAIKVLHHLQELQVYRLKTEFRRLSQVDHPNVVRVYELFNEAGQWFFSMERVRGVPLHHYIASRPLAGSGADDGVELLSLLRQLIEGIAAVHEQGLVHRDVKPANVLVAAGRVVLVDFGLVSEQVAGGVGQTVDQRVSGTLGYIAPEQLRGEPATPASDCYSLGATLHHLLEGYPPLSPDEPARPSPTGESLLSKLPEPARAELAELCARLLSPDARLRPSTRELLGLCRRWPGPERVMAALGRRDPFVGRARELERLEQAYREARSGRRGVLLVQGDSGVGKSMLLGHFARRLRERGVLVLEGRCSEREALPYRGFDEVVDGLSRMLLRLPAAEAAQLVPRHAGSVVGAFPALLRVPAFRDAARAIGAHERSASISEVVSGVKDMLYRCAERRELAIVIEDLQWVDGDTLQLLVELVTASDAPSLCLLSSASSGPRVEGLVRTLSRVDRLPLEPLGERESRELVEALARARGAPCEGAFVECAVRESGGMPLYVRQFVDFRDLSSSAWPRSLAEMIRSRIERLGAPARALLELLAVAERPLPLGLAAACHTSDLHESLRQLVADRLVRSVASSQGALLVEPYTAELRRLVLGTLSAARTQSLHVELSQALEELPEVEPEWLIAHCRAAGLSARAKRYAVLAAERCQRAAGSDRAAQERAARLYAVALELTREGEPEWLELSRRCADGMARAGLYADAADVYLKSARRAPFEHGLELLNAAAAQRIQSGDVAAGVRLLRRTLELVGVGWPEAPADWSFGAGGGGTSVLRGTSAGGAAAAAPRAELRRLLDTALPAQMLLGELDCLRSAELAAQTLPHALDAGDPRRLVLALTSASLHTASLEGTSGERRVVELSRRIDEARRGASGPHEDAWSLLARAGAAYWMGRWKEVSAPARRAQALLQKSGADAVWESALLLSLRHGALFCSGRLPQLFSRLDEASRHSEREPHVARLALARSSVAQHLVQDDVAAAFEALERLLELERGVPDRRTSSLLVATHLYAGNVSCAREELALRWAQAQKLGHGRLPLARLGVIGMEAAIVLADSSAPSAQRERRLRELSRAAAGEPVVWAGALRHALLGAADELAGEVVQAAVELRMAADLFDVAGLSLAAMAARFAGVRLLDGEALELEGPASYEPSAHSEHADQYFRARGVVRPGALVGVLHALHAAV